MNNQDFSKISSMNELRQAQRHLHATLAVRANQISEQYKSLSHSFSLGSLSLWVSEQTTNICSLFSTSLAVIKTAMAVARHKDI